MKAKLAFVDARILSKVEQELSNLAENVVGFETTGITYNSISCHPDVFIFQGDKTTVAPNTPQKYIDILNNNNIDFILGDKDVDSSLENSTKYNCISTEKSLLHKQGYTDSSILANTTTKEFINLPQSYTRCSTLVIKQGVAITSDEGVQKALLSQSWNVFYFDPSMIKIEDHKHGFFGGCCGIINDTVVTLGDITKHADGEYLTHFLKGYKINLLSLCTGHLYDGGGVLFF